jgi:hypothetical protein
MKVFTNFMSLLVLIVTLSKRLLQRTKTQNKLQQSDSFSVARFAHGFAIKAQTVPLQICRCAGRSVSVCIYRKKTLGSDKRQTIIPKPDIRWREPWHPIESETEHQSIQDELLTRAAARNPRFIVK